MAPTDLSEEEREEEEEEDETSSMDTGARGQVPPFEAECEIVANSVVVQVEAVQRLVVGCLGATQGHLAMEPSVSCLAASVFSSKASSHKACPCPHAPAPSHPHESLILMSFDQLSALLDKYLHITSKREEWYKKKLKSERRRQSVWEESLKMVVREGEMLEEEEREDGSDQGEGDGWILFFPCEE